MPGPEPTRSSALDGHYRPGMFGTSGGAPGVTLQERRPSTLAQLFVHGGAGKVARTFPALEDCALPGPGRASRQRDNTVLWTGPDQWVLVSGGSLVLPTSGDGSSDVTVTDLSHARTAIRVSGPHAVDVLLKGCPLDLERFSVDDCAGSLLGHVNVLLHRESDACFDVYVFRSFGLALWEWILDASMEFGVEVSPSLPG